MSYNPAWARCRMVSRKLGVAEGFKTNWLWAYSTRNPRWRRFSLKKREGMVGNGLAGAILFVGAHAPVDPAFRRDRGSPFTRHPQARASRPYATNRGEYREYQETRGHSSEWHYARSRPNLNPHNHIRFYGAPHDRFDQKTFLPRDQRHRDRLYTATPDHNRCRPSSYDNAPSDRMRRRQWRRREPGIDTSRHRNHQVSRMASASRPLSPCLFRPLWPAITK